MYTIAGVILVIVCKSNEIGSIRRLNRLTKRTKFPVARLFITTERTITTKHLNKHRIEHTCFGVKDIKLANIFRSDPHTLGRETPFREIGSKKNSINLRQKNITKIRGMITTTQQ